jgi:VanZ family protein
MWDRLPKRDDRPARRRALAVLAAVLYAVLIFALSSMAGGRLPTSFSHADKLVHALEYAILGALVAGALGGRGLGWRGRGLALVLAVAYAASDELHQGFVPGRDPSLLDLVADTIGAATGILLVARRPRRED